MAAEIPKICALAEQSGILTSNSQENVNLFLEANNLQNEFSFVSSTSKLSGKARHLRSICRTFSCLPEHLLYIGDETRDIKACLKAGVPIASVTWGFNDKKILQEARPDHLIDTPQQLTELIKNLTKS